MENSAWMTDLKRSPDCIAAMEIQNGKSWIENAQAARVQEWNAFLDTQAPIFLWPQGAPGYDEQYGQRPPALYAYPPPHAGAPRGAIIISAGGGWMFKSIWEAEPVARWFHERGFATFIMDYRVSPYGRDISAMDAVRSVRYLRAHAAQLNIDPGKIAVMGGSAGGWQSGWAATMFTPGSPDDPDPVERVSSRPDACILNYGTLCDAERPACLGDPFDFAAQRERARLSVSRHLRAGCPPFFVWQTNGDDPRLGCEFVKQLTDWGIPCEFHIFAEGAHGGGLYDGGHPYAPHFRSTARWAQMAAEFLQNLGFPTEA